MDLDNLQTFHGLFSQYRFHIPDYQRGYAWEEPQWKALMDDLSTLTNHNDHFTGLLVLHEAKDLSLKVKTRGVVKEIFDVVDGQQRLTTIIVLLNEMRQQMLDVGTGDLPEIAASIIDTYLYEPGSGPTLVPKLVLDHNNHEYFKHNILGIDGANLLGAEIQSHKNLLNAQTYFRNYLNKRKMEMGDSYSIWLESLYEKIAKQMKVMVYKLRSEADAGVVFESMNNRGKRPNQLDLVKNYLLYLASKLGPDLSQILTESINQTWKVIFKQLIAAGRGGDEETLLQMHWLTVYDHDLKHWDQEREKSDLIKRRFSLLNYLDRYHELHKELEHYTHTLMNAAVAYADLRKPTGRSDAFQLFSHESAKRAQIIRYSEKLLWFGSMRPFQPLLMAVRMRFPGDAEKYLQFVQLCERYAFRVFGVAERRTSGKEAVLFRLANMLHSEKISFENLEEDFRRDILAECSDALFLNTFAIENAVPWYGKKGMVYFLYEYEEHLFDQREPIINWQTIVEGGNRSVEHILPQNPEEAGYWAKRFTEEDRQKLTHQIGNLTLVLPAVNSSLGRRSFPEKKGKIGLAEACYANSDLKIERELAGLDDWTPQQIAIRQKKLADWALERWHIDTPPQLPPEPWERKLEQAKRNGVEKEFLELNEFAKKLKLGMSVSSKSVVYHPDYSWKRSAITVRIYQNALDVYVRPHHIAPKGFPQERVKEILGGERGWWLAPEQFNSLRSRFEQLISEINETQK